MAANAWSDASVSMIIGECRSQCTRVEAEVNASFRVLKDVWQSVDHDQGSFFLVSQVSGKISSK